MHVLKGSKSWGLGGALTRAASSWHRPYLGHNLYPHRSASLRIHLPPRGARVTLAHAPLAVGVCVAASDAGVAQVVVLNVVETKCSRYISIKKI